MLYKHALKISALLMALLVGSAVFADEFKILRTAEAWNLRPWNKVQVLFANDDNIPEGDDAIDGLEQSLKITIKYVGDWGFGGITPKRPTPFFEKISAWVMTDVEGFAWKVGLVDRKNQEKIKLDGRNVELGAGIAAGEDWNFWEWEKPAMWPNVRLSYIISHNWGHQSEKVDVSMYLYDLTLFTPEAEEDEDEDEDEDEE